MSVPNLFGNSHFVHTVALEHSKHLYIALGQEKHYSEFEAGLKLL